MTKKATLSILSISCLTLVGCNRLMPQSNQPQSAKQQLSQAQEIGQAMKNGTPLKCQIENAEGNKMEYLIKGQKMKMTGNMLAMGQAKSATGAMISDGEMIYIWDETTKEGFKHPLPDPNELSEIPNQPELPDFSNEATEQEYVDQGYTIDCQPGSASDADFTPPADVTFQDLGTMMEQSQNMMDKTMAGQELTPEQQQAIEDAMGQLSL